MQLDDRTQAFEKKRQILGAGRAVANALPRLCFLLVCVLFFCSARPPVWMHEDPIIQQAWADHNSLLLIERCKHLLVSARDGEKELLQLHLATAYLEAEDWSEARVSFAGLLDKLTVHSAAGLSAAEEEVFTSLLRRYLVQSLQDPHRAALSMLEEGSKVLSTYPEYKQVSLLLAVAEFQLGIYDYAFSHAFAGVREYPDHFLAYRIKALLSIKELECATSWDERQELRRDAIRHLNASQQRCSSDVSLSKMLLVLASGHGMPGMVKQALESIAETDQVLPSSLVYLSVLKGAEAGLFDLADDILQIGFEAYGRSRPLLAAQEFLKKRQEGEG